MTGSRNEMTRPLDETSPHNGAPCGGPAHRTAPPSSPPTAGTDAAAEAVATAYAEEWGRIVATLIRFTGDWDLAEECAQEAFATAVERWRTDGVPDRPGAWLTTTARNRALDRVRRSAVQETKLREVAEMAQLAGEAPPVDDFPDDRLRLIFTCCHPALTADAQVVLTLRSLAGLSTAEIARAFLVPEATMAKRLVRARSKIATARIPYAIPADTELPGRLADQK